MPRYDFRSPRLYIDAPIIAGALLPLEPSQAHYLADVLRLKAGDGVLVFNGRDGEWRAALAMPSKKKFALEVEERTREQTAPGDLHYLFAPLKRARLDYMVQKAVEMGVSKLAPVITRHTNAERVNVERMRANAIEAAEQCGILTLPEIAAPVPFARALAEMAPERTLVFCDEDAALQSALEALAPRSGREARDSTRESLERSPETGGKALEIALIIGPEGGFSDDERAVLTARPNTVRISLGPRILRADTAAVAALALVQSVLGDWR